MKRFALLIAALAIAVSLPFAASAFSFGYGSFGGRIVTAIPCTNGGYWITISGPSYGSYIYQAGVSTLYDYHNIFSPGTWVLGTTLGVSTCVVGVFPVPYTLPLIRAVGTSGN